MDFKELKIGNKINMLRVKDSAGNKTKPRQYLSQLLDFDIKNKVAKLSMPIEKNVIVPLEIGDIYRIVIYTSNGLFQCTSKIIKRYKESNLYVIDVQLSGKLEKLQRRQYFRLLCDFEVLHRIETSEEYELKQLIDNNRFTDEEEKQTVIDKYNSIKIEWVKDSVVDISGGGIRFKSRVDYEPESIIIIKIPFLYDVDGNIAQVRARVIRSTKDFSGTISQYDIRAEFISLNSKIRERLVRYIFEEQRKRIKH
ncbi:MAG: hypothetical protein E7265_00130 [Lachnospiraceae bacterium]|nr:hypothetical protein [Lachnospiraceae bacterium]